MLDFYCISLLNSPKKYPNILQHHFQLNLMNHRVIHIREIPKKCSSLYMGNKIIKQLSAKVA